MPDPLDEAETLYRATGPAMFNLNPSTQQEKERQQEDHPRHNPYAISGQGPIMKRAPRAAFRLDQVTRPLPNCTPQIRITGIAQGLPRHLTGLLSCGDNSHQLRQ